MTPPPLTERPLTLTPALPGLSQEFYTPLPAHGLSRPLPAPYWVAWSPAAASELALTPDDPPPDGLLDALAGLEPLPGSQSLASVYSGHQFGVWAGQLGDGRAILLGQAAGRLGGHWEIQLKGSGSTPYSRMGDGRAVLRSSIREFLCSEAMHGLGIPTTRALAIIGADQPVMRESVETAAVVTRLAPSFIRFGHFEHFYANDRPDLLRQLADHVIERFYPSLQALPAGPQRHAGLLREIAGRTARLIAAWQAVGFCHGVMNTDNMSVLGLTLDYGPFGFLDGFDAHHICNHTDQQGRYAYAMQPRVGEWNCYRLGQALMPLIETVELAEQALADYPATFQTAFEQRMRDKLGLQHPCADDSGLVDRLFTILDAGRVDFTRFFRGLSRVSSEDDHGDAACRDLFIDRQAFDGWVADYRSRLRDDSRRADDAPSQVEADHRRAARMDRVNPKYVLRNHLAEIAIRLARGDDELTRLQQPARVAATATIDWRRGRQDFTEIARLRALLAHPFDEQPAFEHYAELPPDWAGGLEVSCSS